MEATQGDRQRFARHRWARARIPCLPGGPFVYADGKSTKEKDSADFLMRRTAIRMHEHANF